MHCISAPYTYQQVVSRSDGEEVNLPEEEGGYEVATAVANDEEGEDGEGEGGYSYVQVRTAMLDVKRTADAGRVRRPSVCGLPATGHGSAAQPARLLSRCGKVFGRLYCITSIACAYKG